MRPAAILLLVLAAPTVMAGVPFELELEDPTGDVRTASGENAEYPSGDILAFTSVVLNGTVQQRIQMAATPVAPDDSILVRNWFHDSENGSFWVVDMEVRGDASDPSERFLPFVRRGDFYNTTYVEGARWGIDGTTWIFEFPASIAEDATCFDPGVEAWHQPARRTRQPIGLDRVHLLTQRRCLTSEEPAPPVPHAPIIATAPRATSPTSEPTDPPGTRTPTPAGGALLAIAALALVATRRRRA